MAREILKADSRMFPRKFNPKISQRLRGRLENIFQQSIVEIPILPEGGNQFDVLIKSSDLDYDVEWSSIISLIGVRNGLNKLTGEIELGGTLIRDTEINGDDDYTFSVIDTFNTIIGATNEFQLRTPALSSKPNGAFLQLLNNSNGNAEWTSYSFPLTAGTNGQILVTDGIGTVSWQNNTGGIDANNGLSLVGTDVQLGGTLIQNTNITGLFDLNININNIRLTSLFDLNLRADRIRVITDLVSSSSVPQGSILRLFSTTGEVEFTPYSLPNTQPINAGAVLISTSPTSLDWDEEVRYNFIPADLATGVTLNPSYPPYAIVKRGRVVLHGQLDLDGTVTANSNLVFLPANLQNALFDGQGFGNVYTQSYGQDGIRQVGISNNEIRYIQTIVTETGLGGFGLSLNGIIYDL